MRQVQDTVAQEQFDELLGEVEQGETIVITRHGKPIAWMVPEQDAADTRRQGD